jgi:hypothetical protein
LPGQRKAVQTRQNIKKAVSPTKNRQQQPRKKAQTAPDDIDRNTATIHHAIVPNASYALGWARFTVILTGRRSSRASQLLLLFYFRLLEPLHFLWLEAFSTSTRSRSVVLKGDRGYLRNHLRRAFVQRQVYSVS